MSSDFWLDLVLALFGFACLVLLMRWFRAQKQRRVKARDLRRRAVFKLQQILPEIVARVVPQDNQSLANQEVINGLRAQLESLLFESDVLFPDERDKVSEFALDLGLAIPNLNPEEAIAIEIEDLILLGQRVIVELTEHGY